MPSCPHCRSEFAEAAESCPRCGVIFAKLANREAAKALAAPAAAAPAVDLSEALAWPALAALAVGLAAAASFRPVARIDEQEVSLLRYALTLSPVNTVFHEGGHVVFGLLGFHFLTTAGGTLMQCLVPIS